MNLDNLRHSCAHLLAAAVLDLYPEALPTLGPSIENGFYYDFDNLKISDSDLPAIEAKMHELVKSWEGFEKIDVSLPDVEKRFAKNVYKIEMATQYKDAGLTLYKSGEFTDLCRGGHCEHPDSELKYFKLMSVAGAYWRGNEKNKMLTRIYGTCWPSQKELDHHLWQLEEADKRDHRKIGPLLDLFMLHETAPGMPYWLPNGLIVLNELISYWRQYHLQKGYKEIASPLINKKELYITSGHWDHYRDSMFLSETEDGQTWALKPMNCPNAMIVFSSKTRSYRDLPYRLSDTDILHRKELSGTLHGLFRVQHIQQDDAHVFVSEDQIQEECLNILDISKDFYKLFDIQVKYRLGTKPKEFMGDEKLWIKAEENLKQVLQKGKVEHFVLEGDGAFYGPKIDILMKDSIGREWQMGTIQLDFQIPLNFKLNYIDSEGKQVTPVVIHRVIYGSFERFIGILIEHYGGAFPVWLAPVQVAVLPISEKHLDYAQKVLDSLKLVNIRCELDSRSESLGTKIRDAEMQKVPFILVTGDKEAQTQSVSVRSRSKKDTVVMTLEEFTQVLLDQIATRANN